MNDVSKPLRFTEPPLAEPDPGETVEWREALLSPEASQGPARAATGRLCASWIRVTTGLTH